MKNTDSGSQKSDSSASGSRLSYEAMRHDRLLSEGAPAVRVAPEDVDASLSEPGSVDLRPAFTGGKPIFH